MNRPSALRSVLLAFTLDFASSTDDTSLPPPLSSSPGKIELLDDLRSAVLRQLEDEVTNFFTEPAAGVNITINMCCFNSERPSADNGSRVTLANASARGMFDVIQKDLTELNTMNRKPFLAQVTVWGAKKKLGFRQVPSVGFFSDIHCVGP
ncbi:hypothetical protein JG688_00010510 [Phytophthora aleatoria]|uniref:Uncharacterized protein n=1 Tax=Phytophthora aleatoria TaxID=2496075 RepID=A0A8J5J4W8_9STRA|nr:hypothetical protein JG688_00010510 [Phytophthora aleatoria]